MVRDLEHLYTKWLMKVVAFDLEEKISLEAQCLSSNAQRLMCGPAFRLEVARWWSTEV